MDHPKESMDHPTEEAASSSLKTRHRLSCTTCFDELWFCYSPVHQMKQYYRHGVLDNCTHKWNTLFDCFSLKTKRSSELQEILDARENSKTHIWSLRTAEEASTHWESLFGHLKDGE